MAKNLANEKGLQGHSASLEEPEPPSGGPEEIKRSLALPIKEPLDKMTFDQLLEVKKSLIDQLNQVNRELVLFMPESAGQLDIESANAINPRRREPNGQETLEMGTNDSVGAQGKSIQSSKEQMGAKNNKQNPAAKPNKQQNPQGKKKKK